VGPLSQNRERSLSCSSRWLFSALQPVAAGYTADACRLSIAFSCFDDPHADRHPDTKGAGVPLASVGIGMAHSAESCKISCRLPRQLSGFASGDCSYNRTGNAMKPWLLTLAMASMMCVAIVSPRHRDPPDGIVYSNWTGRPTNVRD